MHLLNLLLQQSTVLSTLRRVYAIPEAFVCFTLLRRRLNC